MLSSFFLPLTRLLKKLHSTHVVKIWLLLILSSILRLGLKAVPPMQSKTSLPQTWHIPQRIEGLESKPVHSLEICKVIILIKKRGFD